MRISLLLPVVLFILAGCGERCGEGLGYVERTASVAELKSLYRGVPRLITEDITIVGRVVSSDQHRNFYKSFVVEDSTGGVEVKLDMRDIFKSIRYGCRVKIPCCGLWLGSYGGVVQLGAAPAEGFETRRIPSSEVGRFVTLADDAVAPRPERLTVGDIGARHINRFISLESVAFASQESGMTWCDRDPDSGEYRSTMRHLVDGHGDTLDVYTLGEALFAGQTLPSGRLCADGILSGFNGRYQLRVVFESDVMAD